MNASYGDTDRPVNAQLDRKHERLIKTASHVCQIFDCFAPATPAQTLTEITERIGLRGSSVHRLLRTLVSHGYLAVDPATRRYRLGEQLGNCARTYAMSSSVASLARPFLEQLCRLTGETATLQMRSGPERIVVAQVQSTQSIRVVIDDRRPYPLDAGAAGHVLRAFSSDWQHYPDSAKLAAIRKTGYAISRGELIPGALALYCPVPERENGSVQFVVGIQAPEFRAADKVDVFVAELRSVSLALGKTILPGAPIR